MQRFFEGITKNASLALVLLLAVTGFLGFHLTKLRVDTSVMRMLVEDLPQKLEYDRFKAEFGGTSDDILVVFKAPDVFSAQAVQTIGELTEALKSLDGVKRVISLTTIRHDLDFLSEWTLEDLKRNVNLADIFVNQVVSVDGKATAVVVILKQGYETGATTDALEETLTKFRDTDQPLQIYQIGTPVIGHAITQYTQKDLKTLPVFALLIMFLVLWFCFRSLRGGLVPLAAVGLSLVWTFGLMGFMDVALSMVTMIIPVLLIAVGSAYALHIMAAYFDETRNTLHHQEAVTAGLLRICLPTILASATTIVGFASLLLNRIEVTREFAVFSCLGLAFMLIIHLVFIPAVLALMKTPRAYRPSDSKKRLWIETLLLRGFRLTMDHPRAIVVLSSVVALLAVAGLFRIRVETTPMSFFKKDAPLRIAFDDVHKNLSGVYPINVVLRTDHPGYFKSPAALQKVESFQEFVRRIDGVDIASSVVDLLKFEGLLTRNFENKAKYYVIPDDPFIVGEAIRNCRLLDGDEPIDFFVSKDFSRINVACRSHVISTADFIRIEKEILTFTRDHFPREIQTSVTGLTMAVSHSSKAVTMGQIKSLGIALVFIFLLLSLLFVSPRVGFFVMIPNFFPILVNFGIMGWLDIDLCVVTSLVASIAIGLSVDDTIHYACRLNREFKKNFSRERALRETTISVGKPIVFTSLAVGLGFSVLLGSSFAPTVIFGFLMLVTVSSALVSDLLLLPAILFRIDLVTLWDFVSQTAGKDLLRRTALYAGILRSQAGSAVITGFEKNFSRHDTICRGDDSDHTMFLILRGKVMVKGKAEKNEAGGIELSPGDLFGNPAMDCGHGVKFTAIALEKTRLLQVPSCAVKRMKKLFPPTQSTTSQPFVNLEGVLAERQETATGVLNCRQLPNNAKVYSCWLKKQ